MAAPAWDANMRRSVRCSEVNSSSPSLPATWRRAISSRPLLTGTVSHGPAGGLSSSESWVSEAPWLPLWSCSEGSGLTGYLCSCSLLQGESGGDYLKWIVFGFKDLDRTGPGPGYLTGLICDFLEHSAQVQFRRDAKTGVQQPGESVCGHPVAPLSVSGFVHSCMCSNSPAHSRVPCMSPDLQ